MLFPRIVSKNYKLEAMYNFRLRHSVPGLVKHRTNFPKFAVSPVNLITSQTAFVVPCWFPYSAFLEVTSAGPSSGLSPSTLWCTCGRAGYHCPSDLRTAEWHRGRPPRLSYPNAMRLRPKAPGGEPGSRDTHAETPAAPRPTGTSTEPLPRGHTRRPISRTAHLRAGMSEVTRGNGGRKGRGRLT